MKIRNCVKRMGASAILCAAIAGGAQAAPAYHLESAVTLKGASPSWDYMTLDPERSRVFIGRRDAGVAVFDAKTRTQLGVIENSQGANIAAIAPDADRGYTANRDGSTTVFQLSTLKTLGRVKLGRAADAAYYEPATGQVVFTLADTEELVFLDAKTQHRTGRVSLKADLEGVSADGQGFLYVNERDKNRVAKVDARAHAVVAEWPITGCESPTGAAADGPENRIFIGCRGAHPVLAVMDSQNGRVIATPAIGRGNDGVAYDPKRRRLFTSNGLDANIVVFDELGPDTYKFAGAFTTRPIARTMTLDPADGRIFTATAEGVVDPARPINRSVGAFYPNRYLDDTFTVLTYAPDGP